MRVATPVDSCADTLHTSHTRPRPRQNGGRVTQLRFSLFTLLPTSKTIGPSLLFRQYAGSEQQPAPGEGNPLWLGLVHAPRVLGWWLGFLTTPTSFHDDDDDDYVATDVATTRRLAHNLSHLSRKSLCVLVLAAAWPFSYGAHGRRYQSFAVYTGAGWRPKYPTPTHFQVRQVAIGFDQSHSLQQVGSAISTAQLCLHHNDVILWLAFRALLSACRSSRLRQTEWTTSPKTCHSRYSIR